ncbi:FUS-interacting serine-arginine-rich protein 1 [Fasciola gigantica]|uniref:FUS-interacting serine-arginine-rich protein 1 n=1 Tax=Fasciola gigantica TaxID=46835 RepID=A0A504Z0T5_FASGI|nr:FUS-interacting serine-arginine-rich protein 1 [Fasciola gigantica]
MPRRSTSLYIRHLPDACRHEDLRRAFGRYGRIVDITIPLDYFTGRMKGYAFIEYPFYTIVHSLHSTLICFRCIHSLGVPRKCIVAKSIQMFNNANPASVQPDAQNGAEAAPKALSRQRLLVT